MLNQTFAQTQQGTPRKRRIAAALGLVLIFGGVFAPMTAATAHPDEARVEQVQGSFRYAVDRRNVAAGAAITAYYGSKEIDLTIPATVIIDGHSYQVTEIAPYAFYGRMLTSVSMPDSIRTLGRAAFAGNQFTSVTIPSSIVTIGIEAFRYNSLTSVIIPDAVTYIGDAAFQENQLRSVTLGASVEVLGGQAFGFNQIETVIIPQSVKTIENRVFNANPALKKVCFEGTIPELGSEWYDPVGPFGERNGQVLYYTDPNANLGRWSWGYRMTRIPQVRFDAQGGSPEPEEIVLSPCVTTRTTVSEPEPEPSREGYRFTGWYSSPELDYQHDFSLPLYGSRTLYAGWESETLAGSGATPEMAAGGGELNSVPRQASGVLDAIPRTASQHANGLARTEEHSEQRPVSEQSVAAARQGDTSSSQQRPQLTEVQHVSRGMHESDSVFGVNRLWRQPTILMLLGAVALLSGWALLWYRRRKNTSS